MWPLSLYQFCVSLPLEVRTVRLALFLQVPVLLSVLHRLTPAGHVEPVFSDSVFSAAVRRNNRELHNTRKCCLPPVPPLSSATPDMTFCLWKPLPHLPPPPPTPFLSLQLIARLSHLAIARNVPRKPRRSRRGGNVIDFHRILPALQPPVTSLPNLTFTVSIQLSSLILTSVNTIPLPHHLPLHPGTVTTSQPPRSALRCVPLTDS